MMDRSSPQAKGLSVAAVSSTLARAERADAIQGLHDHHFKTEHLLADLKGRTVSSGFITTAAQAAQFVLTLASTMVLARMLAPHDFGLIAMVTTILGFLRVFKDAGLSTATVQRERITHAQVSNLFWVNVALSGTISLVVAASAPAIAWFYREPRLLQISLLLSVTFLFEGSAVQHVALLNRQMRFKILALIQVGSLVTGVVVGIAMAMLKFGYWSLVGFQLATPLTTLLLVWSASGWRPQLPIRRSGTWPLLSFGANLTASTFMWSLARGADSLLIGRVYGPVSVGLYSRAAALLMRPLEQFINPIQAVFVPTFSRLQDRPERYRRTFLRLYQAIALASLLFTALLLALSRPLTLFVLGAKWEKAAPIFAGFTIAALIYPVASAAGWLFTSQGRGKDWLLAISLASLATLGSFIAGLPFGPVGVAIAFSASGILLQLPVIFYLGGRSGPVSTKDLWVGFLRQMPVWIVVCSATWIALKMANGYSLISQLAFSVMIGLVTGAATIWCYPPARGVLNDLLDAFKDWDKFRKATA
jgi:PST family polysaccharide transporter